MAGGKTGPSEIPIEQSQHPVFPGTKDLQMTGKVAAFFRFIITSLIHNPTWGLVFAMAVALVANISTVQYIASLQNDLDVMFNTDIVGRNYVQAARIKLLSVNKDVNNLFLFTDTDERYLTTEKILSAKIDLKTLLAKAKPYYRTKKGARLMAKADSSFAECATTIDSLVALSKSRADSEAVGIICGSMKHEFETLDDRLSYLDGMKVRRDMRLFKDIDYQLTISIIVTLIALVVTICVRIFIFLSQRKATTRRSSTS